MRHMGLSNTDLQVFEPKACYTIQYIWGEWVGSVCVGLGYKRRTFEDVIRHDKCVLTTKAI